MSVEFIVLAKKITVKILAHAFVKMVSIADTSVIVCDEIINATDSLSKNVTNTVPTNMANAISTNIRCVVSINPDDKKVRYKMDCYILITVLLVVVLLFIITIMPNINQNKNVLTLSTSCDVYIRHGNVF